MPEQEDMIRKVQALWARADHPNTPEPEREACIEKARDLMAKYAIDELVLAEGTETKEAVILADIRIFVEEAQRETLVPDQRITLAHVIGLHNRCKSVIRHMPASVGPDGTKILAGTYLTVCGFQSDVNTVRLLYNALGTDMIFAMSEEPTDHMTKPQQRNYFANFCDGFVWRIDERLKDIERKVAEVAEEKSLLPVLRSREVEVTDFFDRMFPNLSKQKVTRMQYDPNAQARGRAAADKANIGAASKATGQGTRGEIGR